MSYKADLEADILLWYISFTGPIFRRSDKSLMRLW